jgi:hypothetical protein
MAGWTWSYGNGGTDMWFIRTDETGAPVWYLTCGSNRDENCYRLKIVENEGYIAIGDRFNPLDDGCAAYLVRIDSDPPGVAPSTPGMPLSYELSPPYPNPFNPTTVIGFQLPVAGWVNLDVFDVRGRNVGFGESDLQTTGFYLPGTHQITFDGTGLASGIYIYQLTFNRPSGSGSIPSILNGKMVLMK